MGFFDRFRSSKTDLEHNGPALSAISIEHTREEIEFIDNWFSRLASLAPSRDGKKAYVNEDIKKKMVGAALSDYVETLIIKHDSTQSEKERLEILDKAFKAKLKAYSYHNLPVLLYQAATLLEAANRQKDAKVLFRLFAQQQEQFDPDSYDDLVLDQMGLNLEDMLRVAKSKIR